MERETTSPLLDRRVRLLAFCPHFIGGWRTASLEERCGEQVAVVEGV
jgi:hypothetical protein